MFQYLATIAWKGFVFILLIGFGLLTVWSAVVVIAATDITAFVRGFWAVVACISGMVTVGLWQEFRE